MENRDLIITENFEEVKNHKGRDVYFLYYHKTFEGEFIDRIFIGKTDEQYDLLEQKVYEIIKDLLRKEEYKLDRLVYHLFTKKDLEEYILYKEQIFPDYYIYMEELKNSLQELKEDKEHKFFIYNGLFNRIEGKLKSITMIDNFKDFIIGYVIV